MLIMKQLTHTVAIFILYRTQDLNLRGQSSIAAPTRVTISTGASRMPGVTPNLNAALSGPCPPSVAILYNPTYIRRDWRRAYLRVE